MAKYLDVIQGSEAWCSARAGIPTASCFDQIITPSGAPSKSAGSFANKLIVEVMLGRPLIGVMTPWMERGKNMEDSAIRYYEFTTGTDTTPVGLILRDDGRVGASPDRLVGDTGLVECKCASDETTSKYVSAHIDMLLGLSDGVTGSPYAQYKCQVQGELYISEREWCDVIAYYPGLPTASTRIYRDELFIAKLKSELTKFLDIFDTRLARLESLGYLDAAAAQARSAKRVPKPEDAGAFGVSEDDITQYIANLKARGELKVEVA